jgi:sugar lactone lactonase YvrE
VDGSGNVYITYQQGYQVLKKTPSAAGYTQSVVANYGTNGLSQSDGVAVDGSGNAYIADQGNNRVVEETSSSGNFGTVNVGSTSGTPISIIFTFDTAGTLGSTAVVTQGAPNLDFTNAGTGTCKAGAAYTVGESCTVDVSFNPKFAGTRYGAAELLDGSGNVLATGYVQGTGVGPQVNFLPGTQSTVFTAGPANLYGIAIDGNGNIYLVDASNNRVLKQTPSAGGYTQSVVISGLDNPEGLALDGAGNIYVSNTFGGTVLKYTPAASGYSQSVVSPMDARYPEALAVDGSGNVYVVDNTGNRVLKETLSNGVYTESTVGTNLYYPTAVAVDSAGNVYIADVDTAVPGNIGNGWVIKESPSNGSYVQSTVASGFIVDTGLTVDGNDSVYITDNEGGQGYTGEVYKETPSGSTYTQTILGSNLSRPWSTVVEENGNVYIINEFGTGQVVKEDFANPPSLTFATTAVGATSSDSPQTVTVHNIGNAPLSFPVPATGDNPSIATNFTLNSSVTSACPLVSSSSSSSGTLAAGESCLLPTSFSPTAAGSLSGSLVLTDNALNVSGATQSISLSGTGTGVPAILTSPTPSSTLTGASVKFAWSTGGGVSAYDLHLSAVAPGGFELYFSGHIAGTSTTVNGLPTNGEKIYARLYTIVDGVTVSNDYTYTAASIAKLLSPAPSSTLTATSVTFTWSAGTPVSQYDLHLSAVSPGGYDLFVSGHRTGTSATANGLPTNGETIYARLYTILNGVTLYNDYTYKAE